MPVGLKGGTEGSIFKISQQCPFKLQTTRDEVKKRGEGKPKYIYKGES